MQVADLVDSAQCSTNDVGPVVQLLLIQHSDLLGCQGLEEVATIVARPDEVEEVFVNKVVGQVHQPFLL